MAIFKCDICGGEITMQANKTGICKQCGMEYSLDAIKAMVNSNSNQQETVTEESIIVSTNSAKDEVDRDTLISYFYNLRVLESLLRKSEMVLKELNECFDRNWNLTSDYLDDLKRAQYDLKELESTDIPVIKFDKTFIIVITLIFILGSLFFFMSGIIVMAIIVLLVLGIIIISTIFKYKERKAAEITERDKLSKKITQYQSIVRTKEERYEKYIEDRDEKNDRIKELKTNLEQEINSVKDNLKNAYSANIIPQPFRNIEGVFYLYEYLASSNQSLSEALMQANLEAIKQKMDNVIKMQSIQIIQQAQTNAKLDNVIRNTEVIADNSALAAKYSIINSVNTALTAMLMSESLAYQKAEFYLK